jgi:hypothetical protein
MITPKVEGLVMLEDCSRAIEAPRTADAAAHPDTKSQFLARERRWRAEVLALEPSWSLVERLYALPF